MFGYIKGFILFILVAAVLVALLRTFGWDVISLIEWSIDTIWNIINQVSRWMEELFGRVFGSS